MINTKPSSEILHPFQLFKSCSIFFPKNQPLPWECITIAVYMFVRVLALYLKMEGYTQIFQICLTGSFFEYSYGRVRGVYI